MVATIVVLVLFVVTLVLAMVALPIVRVTPIATIPVVAAAVAFAEGDAGVAALNACAAEVDADISGVRKERQSGKQGKEEEFFHVGCLYGSNHHSRRSLVS